MNYEFDAISRLFQTRATYTNPLTQLANGDDASVHHIPDDMALVMSTDTAVSGVHWPEDMPLEIAGHRAVCAALSDLAAMGAKATWVWLAVMAKDTISLQQMSRGIIDACNTFHVELAGGDTVSSATNTVSVTVGGLVPKTTAMTRSGAMREDEVWIFGDLGLSAMGLEQWLAGKHDGHCLSSFKTILPLLDIGEQIRALGIRACIDISDGLLQDAEHIAKASAIQMNINVEQLQELPSFKTLADINKKKALKLTLSGGEDYALLFTASPEQHQILQGLGAYCIGNCSEGNTVCLLHEGAEIEHNVKGYDHFG